MAFGIRLFLGSSILSAALAASLSVGAERAPPGDAPDTKISVVPEPTESTRYLHDESKVTQASITIAGHALGYQSEAGILVVHVKDPMDDDAPPVREDKSAAAAAAAAGGRDVLCGLFPRRQGGLAPPDHLPI